MSEDFGKYRLVESIGGGSLGEVYRAFAQDGPGAESAVALKRLARAQLQSDELVALFTKEAHIALQMRHERLLGALDSGEVEGWPFLTTRLASGGSLHQKLAEGQPLEKATLVRIAEDLGAALAATHDLGFTHSDLSPGNLLFEEERVLLADFSATTPIGSSQKSPRGTYAYMCPEQVRGETLDVRSDIFSAAALLWECATGETLFRREAQHLTFMAVVQADLPAMPAELCHVEDALRPALRKSPADRPSDITELCARFTAALLR